MANRNNGQHRLHERLDEHIRLCAEKHSSVVERLAKVEAHTDRNTTLLYTALTGIGALVLNMLKGLILGG